jgi:putative transposase
MKTFVSKLRPTPAQAACLSETVETCRQRYNHALSERKTAYRERGESIGFARQCASLPMLKREVPHLQRVPPKWCRMSCVEETVRFKRSFGG